MSNSENPAYREHLINTEWQKLIDTVYKADADDYIRDTELALEILEAMKLPISFEILRVGSIKLADALLRVAEERNQDG
jgi:hypothetical protein